MLEHRPSIPSARSSTACRVSAGGRWLLGAAAFVIYLTLRSRAFFHTLRAAYPDERIQFRRIWGAYIAAYGFNNVVPRAQQRHREALPRRAVVPELGRLRRSAPRCRREPSSTSPWRLHPVLRVQPGRVPQAAGLRRARRVRPSFLAGHPRSRCSSLRPGGAALVVLHLALRRVQASGRGVRQGLSILIDRRRYLREVVAWQLAGWCSRSTAFWFLLEAFNVGGWWQRAARARRQRRGGGRAVHAGRRGRAAGAARQGLRRRRVGRDRGGLLGRPADRHRGVVARGRLRRARGDLPDPLLQGGDPPGQGGPRAERAAAAAVATGEDGAATAGPDAPRARARPRRGTRSP